MTYTFFFPYIPPSGVSSLFGRLARAIAATRSGTVRLIDYPGGAMARTIDPGSGVDLVEYHRDVPIDIGIDEVLILQAEGPGKFRRQLRVNPGARLIEWQLHPYNLVPTLLPLIGHRASWLRHPGWYRAALGFGLPGQRRNAVALVSIAAQKRSIFFYDLPALRATETFLGCKVANPIFMPVAIDVPPQPMRNRRVATDELHVAWIGRLYDFKVHILVHTIRQFMENSRVSGSRVVFHVIGAGPKQSMLDQFGTGSGEVRIVRHGDLSPGDLRTVLIDRIDLVASMGTAALEGGGLGLPVILLDLAYSEVPKGYRFKWLFQAEGYELGHTITEADCCSGQESLAAILDSVELDYAGVARRCFDYVREHHAMDSVSPRFLEYAGAASLRFADLPKGLFHKSWVRRLYEGVRY